MRYFSKNENLRYHFIFLFILSLYYLIPLFFTGHLILNPNDTLDNEIVFNHIIGKFYKGDIESVKVFLGGKIEWYYLRRVLQPLTLIYSIPNAEVAFWLTDIAVRLIAYISFFKLSRKLNCSTFDSAMISCLFASSLVTHFGLGIACLPYLVYLLIKNKNLNLKNYFIIGFIGFNTDLAYHIYIIPISFLISLIFYKNFKQYNFKLFLKITFVLLICIFISNSNLIYAQLFSEPFHRTEWINETPNIVSNIKIFIFEFLSLPIIKNTPYFFHNLPFVIFAFTITIVSLFLKNKKNLLFAFNYFSNIII